MSARNILARRNRGVLLDALVFVLHLLLMRLLTRYFVQLVRLGETDDPLAKFELGLFFLGAFVLPAAGAALKRWHFHRGGGFRQGGGHRGVDVRGAGALSGCLFHPAFYFSVSVCLAVTAVVILGEQVFGESFHKNGAIFLPAVFGSFALCIVQTWLVYRYFSPPRGAPRFAFMLDPRSALLGDACIYLNMILFQVMWNVLVSGHAGRRPGGLRGKAVPALLHLDARLPPAAHLLPGGGR